MMSQAPGPSIGTLLSKVPNKTWIGAGVWSAKLVAAMVALAFTMGGAIRYYQTGQRETIDANTTSIQDNTRALVEIKRGNDARDERLKEIASSLHMTREEIQRLVGRLEGQNGSVPPWNKP